MEFKTGRQFALDMDARDLLADYRNRFHIPGNSGGESTVYLCGNSLGLPPKSVRRHVEQVLKDWETLGVEGHFKAADPWMSYHEWFAGPMARLVGANPAEVISMNALTVNLHLIMVSFYRPVSGRHKILIETQAFPSDRYAVESQIQFHGYDPRESLIELPLRTGEVIHRGADIEALIEQEGDSIALVLLSGVNYYTGQVFDMKRITRAGHSRGCTVAFDLAHAIGNIPMELHDWGVDTAVWCTYKYLNGGPGCIAGCFIHQRHLESRDLPRFAGWWGQDKKTRFLMGADFSPIPTAEGWQLSNPPILSLAALRASLEVFEEVGMAKLREKSRILTGYLEYLVDGIGQEKVMIITPRDETWRGCQLSLVIKKNARSVFESLSARGVICDWREPEVIRVAPVPLYNSFLDVYSFAEILRSLL